MFLREVRKLAYQLAIAYAEDRTLILDTSVPWKYTDKGMFSIGLEADKFQSCAPSKVSFAILNRCLVVRWRI